MFRRRTIDIYSDILKKVPKKYISFSSQKVFYFSCGCGELIINVLSIIKIEEHSTTITLILKGKSDITFWKDKHQMIFNER